MESRIQSAANLKHCGTHNCAQAVACAYADRVGLTEETAYRLTAAFGSGMATMEGTCGAIVGAGFIIGLAAPDRAQARRDMRQLITAFRQRNGATICSQLKGVGTGVVLRECTDCVADAAEFLESLLPSQG